MVLNDIMKLNFVILIVVSAKLGTVRGDFSAEDCKLLTEENGKECKKHKNVFSWDDKTQTCKKIKEGCPSSLNSFKKKKECIKVAEKICRTNSGKLVVPEFSKEDCQMGTESQGKDCDEGEDVWSWNDQKKECKETKGGCSSSPNSFKTEKECNDVTEKICNTTNGKLKLEFSEEDCEMGTESKGKDCKKGKKVWSWNDQKKSCKKTKGGCSSSPNSFKTEKECNEVTEKICNTTNGKLNLEFSEEDCEMGTESKGKDCKKGKKVWSWNDQKKSCKKTKGGCSSSPNSFKTEKECNEVTEKICNTTNGKLKLEFSEEDCEMGTESKGKDCKKGKKVWSWNDQKKSCKKTKGGCSSSPNIFQTKKECKKIAEKICDKNLQLLDLDFSEEDCQMGTKAKGIDCERGIDVWSWSQTKKACRETIGGCSSSPNSFETKIQCENVAQDICKNLKIAEFTKNDCSITPHKELNCADPKTIWYWNDKKMKCHETGTPVCSESSNSFTSKQDCTTTAKPICEKSFTVEDCFWGTKQLGKNCEENDKKKVWSWNHENSACLNEYGGCSNSRNSFATHSICKDVAGPICLAIKGMKFTNKFAADDCYMGTKNFQENCAEGDTIWRWDIRKNKCAKALGGCRNHVENSFPSEKECKKVAKPICKTLKNFTIEDCTKPHVIRASKYCNKENYVFKFDQKLEGCTQVQFCNGEPTANFFKYKQTCDELAKPICLSAGKSAAMIQKDPSEFDKEDCFVGLYIPQIIDCRNENDKERWFWNHTVKDCQKKNGRKCKISNNNFDSKENCLKVTKPVCENLKGLPDGKFTKKDCKKQYYDTKQKCDLVYHIFYWNHNVKRCVPALYDRCKATRNIFLTKEECEHVAKPICDKVPTKFVKKDCNKGKPKDDKLCKTQDYSWYWDPKQLECALGCGKDRNKFELLEDCEKIAKPVCKKKR